MAFTLPNYNLNANFYVKGVLPGTGPLWATIPVQLYIYSRAPFGRGVNAATQGNPVLICRVTSGLLGTFPGNLVGATLALPDVKLTWAYYVIVWWDVVHKGFPNEYLMLQLAQCDGNAVTPDSRR
jgi:hypothetical protein